MSQTVTCTVAPGRSLLEAVPGSEHIVRVFGTGRTAGGPITEERTVAVDHKRYMPSESVQLPAAEAQRLAELGFVRID